MSTTLPVFNRGQLDIWVNQSSIKQPMRTRSRASVASGRFRGGRIGRWFRWLIGWTGANFKGVDVLDRSLEYLDMTFLGHHSHVHSTNLPIGAQDEIFNPLKSPKSSWVAFIIHGHHLAYFQIPPLACVRWNSLGWDSWFVCGLHAQTSTPMLWHDKDSASNCSLRTWWVGSG